MKSNLTRFALISACLLVFQPAFAQQSTAFNYQGQLRDGGTNAVGAYSLIFKLFDALTNGNPVGLPLTNTAALTNGFFSVNLDFGEGVFNGGARWLDITVRNGGDTETLSPRVQILPAPYTLFSAVAGAVTNGGITANQLATGAVGAANLQDGAVTDAKISASTSVTRMLGETNLVIIRGSVNSNGEVLAGKGFTVTPTSSNTRNITFTRPFSGFPTIAMAQHGSSGGAIVDWVTASPTGFSTVANGSSGFEFIAIGPQ